MTPSQILDRQRHALDQRRTLEAIWTDAYAHVLPKPHEATALFDATAADAAEQLAAALLAELTPPWSRWFGLAPARDLADTPAGQAAAYALEGTADVLQSHLDRSNFAVEMHQAFLDLVITGTGVLLVEEAPPGETSALRFTAVPVRHAVLEEGPSGRLDNVYRETALTLAEIRRRFPFAELPPALDRMKDDEAPAKLRVVEAVWPDRFGHRYAAVLDASAGAEPVLLAQGGFADPPYIAFRWLKAPGEVYGRGPVVKALPDIRTANRVVELVLKNASIAVTGIWQAEDDGVLNPATVQLVPGAIIPRAPGSAGLTPLAAPGNFDVSQLMLNDLRSRIRQALLVDRLGVRLSAEPGAYIAHNRHVFFGPAFELQAEDRPIAGIPFLSEVSSRAVIAYGLRMERCSRFVARHTGAAQDHVYEVAWASQAYGVDIDYAPGSTRVGSVVRGLHQAAAHREYVREVASVPCLRAAAYRWTATQTGFDRLACLSSNVGGTPATLADYAFTGLDAYALGAQGVTLQGGRGLGFVVDARRTKEFALAADADNPRLVVQCFDAAMNIMTDANGPLVRASGMSLAWNPTARWWHGAADLNDANLTRLQAVRLEPSVGYAIIGVARIGTDYEVRAMRLACDPAQAPPLLFGLPGLPHGGRHLRAEQAYEGATFAANSTLQVNVPVPAARPGDFAQAAYTLSTSAIVFLAQIGAQDLVTVTMWNRSAGSVPLNPGTVRVRVVKS